MPLDPSGQVPGQVQLSVARFARSANPTGGTIFAFAGGPGQAAVDLLGGFAQDMSPLLGNRALVVFDPRGVGLSDPLRCRVSDSATRTTLSSDCAQYLGARRAFYSTANSVADTDAVRTALGLQRISLYGVSYGTYTALAYARAHPDAVDRMVLDSVVPSDADPAVKVSRITAMRRVLGQLCSTACPGVSPLNDLGAILRLPPGSITVGRRRFQISQLDNAEAAYEVLVSSDLDPQLRASIPAAFHLAAAGDIHALGRLTVMEANFGEHHVVFGRARAFAAALTVDAVPIATKCSDVTFPWSSSDPLAVREQKLLAAGQSLPDAAIQPFDRTAVIDESTGPGCLGWPEAGNTPNVVGGPLPSTPALLLTGADDIRTPLEDSSALAAQLPAATLLTVPNVGHSVLGVDESGCASRAVTAFFAAAPVSQCAAQPPARIDPLPPALGKLSALPGVPGAAGRTLRAAVLTLRHDIGFVEPAALQVGFSYGTQGGSLTAGRSHGRTTVKLYGLSYVKGVALDGQLKSTGHGKYIPGRLTVSVGRRRAGVLNLGANGKITGRIGGRAVNLSVGARERIDRQGGLAVLG